MQKVTKKSPTVDPLYGTFFDTFSSQNLFVNCSKWAFGLTEFASRNQRFWGWRRQTTPPPDSRNPSNDPKRPYAHMLASNSE